MPKPSRYLKGARGGGSGKQHRGGRGRGGRGGRGGGRGRGRRLHPSWHGYVYEPGLGSFRESDDDLVDDFPVFGQFGAVDVSSDDSDQDFDQPARGRQNHRSRSTAAQNGDQRATRDLNVFVRGASLLPASDDDENVTDNKTREASASNNKAGSSATTSCDSGKEQIANTVVVKKETTKYTMKQPIIDPIEYELDIEEETNIVETTNNDNGGKPEILPFILDATPTVVREDDDEDNDVEMEKPKALSKSEKRRLKKKTQKKKIIPGDDIYLGSSSSEEHYFVDDEDDDIAAMRDYIENVHLDEDDEDNESDMLAMLRFSSNVDPAEMRDDYAPSEDEEDNDDDSSSIDSENMRYIADHGDDQDTVENGAFDYDDDSDLEAVSVDEFYNDIGELTTEDLYNSLRNSLDEVPPSLQAGLRGRIAQERRKEKKAKRVEKQVARMQKREQRKEKGKKNYANEDVQLRKIDQRLQNFINDPELMSYQFAPMSRGCRRQLHILASAYGLTSESFGTGKQRTPVVRKTGSTMLPANRHHIDMFIRNAQSSIDAQSDILRKRRNMDKPKGWPAKKKGKGKEKAKGKGDKSKNKQGQQQQQSGQKTMTAAVRHGTVVGANVGPISENNVGHRMLAAMGWKQGDALGANNDGIRAPIEAVVRTKRFGLGS